MGKLLTLEILQTFREFDDFPAKYQKGHPLENLERCVDVAGIAVILNIRILNDRNPLSVTSE